MASVKLEEILPYIQGFLPGCAREDMVAALAESAATFFARSGVWRYDLDEATTEADESTYEIDVPTGTVLERLEWFLLDGLEIPIVSDKQQAPSMYSDTGAPQAVALYAETSVRLYPTPDKAYTYSGVVILKPSLSSTVLDKNMFETWGRVIGYGALSTLLPIPGQPWFSPEMAQKYGALFDHNVTTARVRDFRGVPLRVQPRPFF